MTALLILPFIIKTAVQISLLTAVGRIADTCQLICRHVSAVLPTAVSRRRCVLIHFMMSNI